MYICYLLIYLFIYHSSDGHANCHDVDIDVIFVTSISTKTTTESQLSRGNVRQHDSDDDNATPTSSSRCWPKCRRHSCAGYTADYWQFVCFPRGDTTDRPTLTFLAALIRGRARNAWAEETRQRVVRRVVACIIIQIRLSSRRVLWSSRHRVAVTPTGRTN